MKKILVFIAAALLLSSCFGDQKNTLTYTLQANFDYWEMNPENQKLYTDSLFTGYPKSEDPNAPEPFQALGWQDLAFCFHTDEARVINGGFMGSYSRDWLPFDQITAETTFPKYWSVYEDKTYKEPEKKPESKADGEQKPEEHRTNPPHGFVIYHANPDQEQMPKHDVVFMNTAYGTCTMAACIINNTAQNVAKLKNSLAPGQYVKVIATGIRDEKETGKAEIFIAEHNEERNFVMKEWTKFDLAPLGDIDFIDFEWETNCPEIEPYFCLDLVTAAVALSY